jgi:hypothetical protein
VAQREESFPVLNIKYEIQIEETTPWKKIMRCPTAMISMAQILRYTFLIIYFGKYIYIYLFLTSYTY